MNEVVQARFVKVPRPDEQSYSIRFFGSNRNLSMSANFTVYDSNGNLVKEKAAKFDGIYTKYGGKSFLY